VEVQELAPGLWRWTVRHPTFDDPALGTNVGCVYAEAEDAIVLIDPLVPEQDDERERFLRALDRDVDRLGRPVAILLTCSWHARTAAELRERYETTDAQPADVVSYAVADDEVIFWLPRHRAVVAGDVLLGIGGLRRCPDAWVAERGGVDLLMTTLREVAALDVELVLPAHGEPIVRGAKRALAAAIEGAPFDG